MEMFEHKCNLVLAKLVKAEKLRRQSKFSALTRLAERERERERERRERDIYIKKTLFPLM